MAQNVPAEHLQYTKNECVNEMAGEAGLTKKSPEKVMKLREV